jgi:hypothetical protein
VPLVFFLQYRPSLDISGKNCTVMEIKIIWKSQEKVMEISKTEKTDFDVFLEITIINTY